MSRPLPFRRVGDLTGAEREAAEAYLERLATFPGRPSEPVCPHPDAAHVTEADGVVWCPWCSGDLDAAMPVLARWFRQDVPAESDLAVTAQAEALRAAGWSVSPPPVGMVRRRATAWDAAAALGLPRKLVAQLLRWLMRDGQVVADGTAEAVWGEERLTVTAWRAL